MAEATEARSDRMRAEALADVAAAAQALTQARDDLIESVRSARTAGATWAHVGAVLGISRQAAHERFAP